MNFKIDYKALELAIEKPLDKAFRQTAIRIATDKLNDAKSQFLINFASHPVSQEIEEGEQIISDQFLPSKTVGNLFSFIGFDQGSKPIEDLYQFLEKHIYIRNLNNPTYDKAKKRYIFDVMEPSRDSISNATPAPFGTARSWVYGLEAGILGLNHYLTIQKANLIDQLRGKKRSRESFPTSHSTTAIQSKSLVTSGRNVSTPQRYLTDLLKTFENSLQ